MASPLRRSSAARVAAVVIPTPAETRLLLLLRQFPKAARTKVYDLALVIAHALGIGTLVWWCGP